MNPIRAIRERMLRLATKHYHLLPWGRRLRMLKDVHHGKRCFIIGNGPSLSASDLTCLYEHDEITFGFNRVFHIFSDTPWRPTYYMSQDDKMLKGCVSDVERLTAKIKFVPIEMPWYYGIKVKGAHYYHTENGEVEGVLKFSDEIDKCVVLWGTVVYSAIQFAAYMGIKEIYLIGVDHHFQKTLNMKGEIVIDPTAKSDYFCKAYDADKDELYIPNTDRTTQIYEAAKCYADQRGIKIYNATRGGKLEVFPRVEFDSLF